MSRLYVVCEVIDPKTKKPLKLISSIHPDTIEGSNMALRRSMRKTRNGMPSGVLSISITKHRPIVGM